ncbi:MAG: exodeoxyribonuclease VII small subunit [Nigerium sp.]|nr:exodeoxyribonuclease VII small subunit [Nigerium sp.]
MSDTGETRVTYEQAREQLVEVVRQLESGNVPLSTAMELWERGEKLAAVCQEWLDGARARVDAARPGAVG